MESEITEQDSVLLTKNLLRIAIFNICYIRDLFPEKFFVDQPLPAVDMTVKKLKPMDAESRRLIDWVEKGVYHALEKKYLKTLLFCICEAVDGPMIEEYTFSFSYSNTNSEEVSMNINDEVSMNINRSGKKKHNSTTGMITISQIRSPACKMLCRLFQLKSTLEKMPEERTVLMKLLYDDDVTPMDYEPPFFRGCTEKPLNMEVGEVNSKHLVLALKVKSRLDPCEDDQYIAAPREKQQLPEENGAVDEDNTQDPAEDEQQLGRVKDWIRLISSIRIGKFEFNDVLSYFPDISVVLIEEIMDKLVKESIISKAEGDSYTINKKKGVARKRELWGNNTPTSKADQDINQTHRPATSRESGVPVADSGRVKVDSFHGDEMDIDTESRSSQAKRFRKASTVKEPIQQFAKRQKSQAV